MNHEEFSFISAAHLLEFMPCKINFGRMSTRRGGGGWGRVTIHSGSVKSLEFVGGRIAVLALHHCCRIFEQPVGLIGLCISKYGTL